jgi:hypothetical protein
MAPQDTAMEPRPNPRWPRGTCFAWELLRGSRKGSMLDGTGPLLCIEVEEPGGPHESGAYGVQFQPVPPWEWRKRSR